MPKFAWAILLAVSFAASRGFERIGDGASSAGDHGTALLFQLAALGLLISAIFCGWKFFSSHWRSIRRSGQSGELEQTVRVFQDSPQAPAEFDPDAALASYLAKQAKSAADNPAPARTFGRKQN